MIDRVRMHRALDRVIDSCGGRAKDDNAGLSKARAEQEQAYTEWCKAETAVSKAFAKWREADARYEARYNRPQSRAAWERLGDIWREAKAREGKARAKLREASAKYDAQAHGTSRA